MVTFLAGQSGFFVPIDEIKMRPDRQPFHRAAHGEKAGLQNIVSLDFLDRGDTNGPVDFRMFAEKLTQFFAVFRWQDFRVIEMPMRETVGNDCCGSDRPGRPSNHALAIS